MATPPPLSNREWRGITVTYDRSDRASFEDIQMGTTREGARTSVKGLCGEEWSITDQALRQGSGFVGQGQWREALSKPSR